MRPASRPRRHPVHPTILQGSDSTVALSFRRQESKDGPPPRFFIPSTTTSSSFRPPPYPKRKAISKRQMSLPAAEPPARLVLKVLRGGNLSGGRWHAGKQTEEPRG